MIMSWEISENTLSLSLFNTNLISSFGIGKLQRQPSVLFCLFNQKYKYTVWQVYWPGTGHGGKGEHAGKIEKCEQRDDTETSIRGAFP